MATKQASNPYAATLAPLAAAVAEAVKTANTHKAASESDAPTVGDRFRAYAAAAAQLAGTAAQLETLWPEKLSEKKGKETIKFPVVGRSALFDPYAAAFNGIIEESTMRTVYSQLRTMTRTMLDYPTIWAGVSQGISKEMLIRNVATPLKQGKIGEVRKTPEEIKAANEAARLAAKQNGSAPLTSIANAIKALADAGYAIENFRIAFGQLRVDIEAQNLARSRAAKDATIEVAPAPVASPAPPHSPVANPVTPAPVGLADMLANLMKAGVPADQAAAAAAAFFVK